MIERPVHIVDASVAVRWHLANPPFVQECLQVLNDYQRKRIDLLAPDNLFVETVGAIHQAVIGRLIRAAQGEQMMQDFFDWRIRTVHTLPLLQPAYRLSVRLGCSFYDSIYLALAEQENIPFVHADGRLRNALGKRFPLALWIEDYPSTRS